MNLKNDSHLLIYISSFFKYRFSVNYFRLIVFSAINNFKHNNEYKNNSEYNNAHGNKYNHDYSKYSNNIEYNN